MEEKKSYYKIFLLFLMTCFCLHIFLLDLKIPNMLYSDIDNPIYRFYLLLWVSMNQFDIIWVILFVFIFYYLYHHYFIDNKWNRINVLSFIVSFVVSLFIIFGISIYYYKNLSMITHSFVQFYKCMMVGIGYYFLIYPILRNVFFKISSMKVGKNVKK